MRALSFGVSGWTARFDDGFDETSVSSIAAALGQLWSRRHGGAAVAVGYDTRHDSQGYATLVGSILAAYGLTVRVSASVCPSPALCCAVAADPACIGGVRVSGSDAPCEYGGISVCGSDGGSISQRFAKAVDQLVGVAAPVGMDEFDTADLMGPYRACLNRVIKPPGTPHRTLKIVVDPMHGVGAQPLLPLLKELGCDVTLMHGEQREDFGGLHPEAAEPWVDDCEAAVVQGGADLGIVLDGDAMRSAVIDAQGTLVTPHKLIPVLLDHLVRSRRMSGRVVCTMASSAQIRLEAERLGLGFTAVPVGFDRIHDELLDGDVLLGCEEFGNACLPIHLPERDGMLVALLVVESLLRSGQSLAEAVSELEAQIGPMSYGRRDMRLDPAKLRTLSNALPGLNPGVVAGEQPRHVSHADGLKLEFFDDSWLMVRPSRREPTVRIYAEAHSVRRRDKLLNVAIDYVEGGYQQDLLR